MKLYCAACNRIENFTPGEAERVVYALVAMEADERCESNDHGAAVVRADAGRDPMLSLTCLAGAYVASLEVEAYAEHVGACVDERRARP